MSGELVALLLVVSLLATLAARQPGTWRHTGTAATVVLGALLLAIDVVDTPRTAAIAAPLGDLRILSFLGDSSLERLTGLLALAWCGPPADQVVRGVLALTGIDLGRDVQDRDVRTGRWLGRLERWFILVVIAAGQPALAAIPVGGKALFRYAETVADARRSDPDIPGGRDLLIEYVIIGSFASWGQATLLALVTLGGTA